MVHRFVELPKELTTPKQLPDLIQPKPLDTNPSEEGSPF